MMFILGLITGILISLLIFVIETSFSNKGVVNTISNIVTKEEQTEEYEANKETGAIS